VRDSLDVSCLCHVAGSDASPSLFRPPLAGLNKKYADDVLMMEQEDMPTDYLVKCFGDEFQELSRRHAAGSEELSTAKSRLIDQFEIIATSRRDDAVAHAQLQEAVLQARREPMDPAEAYRVLGAAADTDDFTLQTSVHHLSRPTRRRPLTILILNRSSQPL
jgi:hypothetical protein